MPFGGRMVIEFEVDIRQTVQRISFHILESGFSCGLETSFFEKNRLLQFSILKKGGSHAIENAGQKMLVRQFLGNGQTFYHSYPDVAFSFLIDDRNVVRISIRNWSPWVSWDVWLAAPDGQQLAPGYYPSAQRAPFLPPGVPGFNLSGATGCNTVEAAFMVHQVTFDASGNLKRLQATFEQHCEGQAPAARGEVVFIGQ